MAYNQGILTPLPWLAFEPKTQFGIAQQWYPNRNPLVSRLPQVPTNARTFNIVRYGFRKATVTLTVDPGTSGNITVSTADAAILMNGDRLLLTTNEVVELTAAPNTSTGVLTVRRGASSTTPTAIATPNATTGLMINLGNSRTGGEINQIGIQQVPTSFTQVIQTFQHVVQVSGIVQAMAGAYPTPGQVTPFEKNKMDAMRNLMDDLERAALWGVKEDITTGVERGAMAGAWNQITTNAITSPTNASAYKPSDFNKDVIKAVRDKGGEPTLILASSGFMLGLAKWGLPLQRFTPGKTSFGIDVNGWVSPFFNDMMVVEDMWLEARYPNSAIILDERQARMRVLEDLKYLPYGRRGDTGIAGEGDWIYRGAIEIDNEDQHATIRGITGFAIES